MPLETHTCKRFFTLLNFESYITEIRYMLEVGLGKFYKRAAIHSASRSYGFVDRGLLPVLFKICSQVQGIGGRSRKNWCSSPFDDRW